MYRIRLIRGPFRSNFICCCVARSRLSTSTVTSKNEPGEEDKPYPFMSQYKMNKYKVVDTFRAPESETWEYQPFIIIGCLAVFLIYFCILREEHDTDEWLAKSLYETIPGLEEQDLKRKIKLYQALGKDTKVLENRLELLLAQKG